eukprot:2771500-Ditylum_brightwellii.AAC.1
MDHQYTRFPGDHILMLLKLNISTINLINQVQYHLNNLAPERSKVQCPQQFAQNAGNGWLGS